jgi:transposase-like protein
MDAPRTLREALVYFSDPENCQRFMIELRWVDGVVHCPKCGSEKVTYLANDRRWKCYAKHPRAKFSLKVGTVLPAMWLIANCKNGISSWELHRALGVTQKTAWFMLQRIRLAMQNQSIEKIVGDFEVDESFIGGSAHFMNKDKKAKITDTGGNGGGKVDSDGPAGSQEQKDSANARSRYQRPDATRRGVRVRSRRLVCV